MASVGRLDALARVCAGCVALCLHSGARAEPAPSAAPSTVPASALSLHFSHELGVGYEAQSSPLIRLSPDASLVFIDGLSRLNGAHARAAVVGLADLDLGRGWHASLSTDASVKQSPHNRDLNFTNVSVQSALRWSHSLVSVGVGPTAQRFDVANRHFRTAQGVHADVNLAGRAGWPMLGEQDRLSLIADVSRYRHPAALSDLDARAQGLVLQHHLERPIAALDAVEWSLHANRERNVRGFADLSQRSLGASASVQWTGWGMDWSLGAHSLLTRFDEATFFDAAPRRDRSLSVDVAVEVPVGEKHTWRLEFIDARNRSNTPLYDNRYQQVATSLRTAW